MTPGDFGSGHSCEDIDEIGQSDQLAKRGAAHPFPDVCAYPECEATPIVGVNRRFVCQDHLEWVLIPIRDLLRIVL